MGLREQMPESDHKVLGRRKEKSKNNGDFESSFPARGQSPALPSRLPPSESDSSTQPTDLKLINSPL